MIFLALTTKPFGSQTTELYPLELDGSDWQYLQLNGERLIWTSDLESLKNFVENCLQQQGKWSSPGGNNTQFKSCNDSGAPAREARVGQSPIPMEYGQPLFVWLSRD